MSLFPSTLLVKAEHTSLVASCVRQYETVKRDGTLLKVTFTSVHEYLHLLRVCCQCLEVAGSNVMLYLAAAVSDFHIPSSQMVRSCHRYLVLGAYLGGTSVFMLSRKNNGSMFNAR